MHFRPPLLIIGHFFLVLAFLLTPIVDNIHAIKMLGGATEYLHGTAPIMKAPATVSALAPCHEATIVSTATAMPDPASTAQADDKQPCCPYDECSPDNCLMHMAMASISTVEMLPHLPVDHRSFLLTDINPVTLPISERLRPPIA
jgi:hypothetical protein